MEKSNASIFMTRGCGMLTSEGARLLCESSEKAKLVTTDEMNQIFMGWIRSWDCALQEAAHWQEQSSTRRMCRPRYLAVSLPYRWLNPASVTLVALSRTERFRRSRKELMFYLGSGVLVLGFAMSDPLVGRQFEDLMYSTTGSSLMPQKKNADSLEPIRSKAGRGLWQESTRGDGGSSVLTCYIDLAYYLVEEGSLCLSDVPVGLQEQCVCGAAQRSGGTAKRRAAAQVEHLRNWLKKYIPKPNFTFKI
ncbi:argininosuccinate lyase isoform X2 [Lates japonicus]|uniref:Argininosuccinate lyase isoform X2 n=1 Tax=Lates japonicus TaxID=270547 RepID=A0AAD3M2R1_LATJO|nr:argininosuccinate lyase isoform X2 [Lates japonicus]